MHGEDVADLGARQDDATDHPLTRIALGIDDLGRQRAGFNILRGGLGMRPMSEVAIPAQLGANRTLPKIELCHAIALAGLRPLTTMNLAAVDYASYIAHKYNDQVDPPEADRLNTVVYQLVE